METFAIRDLTFCYPEQTQRAIDNLSLSVKQGEFLVLCGPSGCGKSTLLRQLKTVLRPHGYRSGQILFEGVDLDALDQRTQSEKIGFVMQSPENQIVTDKVWHELAFGLESLGYDTPTIRRRVAEMASFFGIESWFYKNVTDLSGGQKQLLILASIMAMQPSVLILDEPTSQLDPIAASEFLETIGKINRELGITVILTEHRLEEAFPLASRVAVMDRGRIICEGHPEEVGSMLKESGHKMFAAMPAPMRIWSAVPNNAPCPISVRDGRNWLSAFAKENPISLQTFEDDAAPSGEPMVEVQDVWFKYEKDLPDVVKGLTLTAHRGEFLAVLGGNGTGKTTSLGIIAGLRKPYRGEVKLLGSVGVLPQNPQALFVKKTVGEDLLEILNGSRLTAKEKEAEIARVAALCRLTDLLERHPYDLSGGEQQRAALAKILLLDPDILLMDEPTKGLDAEFKQVFASILKSLLQRGVTIIMTSHDVEFCAEYAHRCALFFDGCIVAQAPPHAFFSGNNFYTTSANRMARGIIDGAVTARDLIAACGGQVPSQAEAEPIAEEPQTVKRDTAEKQKSKPLPWWRKAIAAIAAVVSIALFISFISVTDLSSILNSEFSRGGDVDDYFARIIALIASLFTLALAVGQRSSPATGFEQVPKNKRKLPKRTVAAAAAIILLIPLTLFVGAYYLGGRKYYFIALMVLLECMIPFFLLFEGRKPQARELVIIAVLCAIGVAGRAAFFMLPQFKPVMALVIISGVAFGGETGFLVGAMTMLASNVLFSQGPWTPWQMFAMGLIGFLAGILFRKGLLRRSRISLCVFGGLAALIIYGGIMNPASALIWAHSLNCNILLSYYITGFPMDLVHAAATMIFLWFAAEPMLEKLDRIKVKYGLVE